MSATDEATGRELDEIVDHFKCSWCGSDLERIYSRGPHDKRRMGECEDDGIVYADPKDPKEVYR